MFMKTTDRGKTWKDIKISGAGSASQFESLHFLNENIGFTLDVNGYLYKSIDGGETWFEYKKELFDDNNWGLHFYDENVGCILGQSTCLNVQGEMMVAMTYDGGNSWDLQQVSPRANTKFADPLILNANGAGYAISSGMLWESTNGNDWKPIDFTGGYDWHEEITHANGSFCVPVSNG
jgi:photosystem II stability/assembly factor-like uncharacterized protein